MPIPDLENCELDFSEFHPLMHWAFSPECFGWTGGPVRHLQDWYEYQFEYSHDKLWHRLAGCAWGRHQTTSMFRKHDDGRWIPVARICHWCDWMYERKGLRNKANPR